ncbi:glycosyltransferase [uncultured Bacteroides sp.]|uniref:glycosyltransferase n=1 Tax=uncultured Bacteroides sp. TaxID=162156 RepID=UPI0025963F69|nr:glycosyltransferase [uncultured Bacteroides sp.]
MGKKESPLVSIRCTVYNHEPYLRQCLDGFVMQKTNFAFEAIVHDDASTDNSAEIIREYAEKYPDIIKPIYETENQYSKQDGSLDRIMNEHTHGKYVAFCEGDDYWTDPLKLQKQVEILEKNSNIGLCYTKIIKYIQEKGKNGSVWGGNYTNFNELLISNTIPTLTCLLRKDLVLRYYEEIKPENKSWKMGDYPMWLWISYNSNIFFLPEITGVYRVVKESASHSSNLITRVNFVISTFDIRLFFASKYNMYQYDILVKESLWWHLIHSILSKDLDNISLYKKKLNGNTVLKKKIIIFLSDKYPKVARFMVKKYIKHFIG